MIPSQSPHSVTSPVIQNVRSLANRQNQHKRRPLRNSHLAPAGRCVSIPAGKRHSSQGGSSVATTIQGQNYTHQSSPNTSHVEDITQSATQQHSIITPTATPGTSSHNTPAPCGTSQTDSTCHVVSGPASGIASTPTPLSSLENLPTPILNPEVRAIITNPLRSRATEPNQRQRQWQLQTQAASAPRSVVSSSCSIQWLGHSNMTCHVFATGRLLELYMWNRRPFMSASDMETVCCATRRVAKSSAEAPHW